MTKIKLMDGVEREVFESTAIHPSYNTNSRNRLEIYMDSSAMSLSDFVSLFSEANTEEIHIIGEVNLDGKTKTIDTAYLGYSYVSSVGLQRSSTTNLETGEPVEVVALVAVLEQLTYVEKQLKAMGVNITA